MNIVSSNGKLQYKLDGTGDPFESCLAISLTLPKGSFFYDLSFGHRFREIKTTSRQDVELAAAFAVEATQWLIKIKRAQTISATAKANDEVPGRIDIFVDAVKSNGETVKYATFFRVV